MIYRDESLLSNALKVKCKNLFEKIRRSEEMERNGKKIKNFRRDKQFLEDKY